MGRLQLDSSGASPMAVDEGIKGRRRSEGGERLTQKAWREAGEVEKEWVKGEWACPGNG